MEEGHREVRVTHCQSFWLLLSSCPTIQGISSIDVHLYSCVSIVPDAGVAQFAIVGYQIAYTAEMYFPLF